MTAHFSAEQMRKQLSQAFGNFEIRPVGNKMSASVSGFAAYGRNNFLLSAGGDHADGALKNLFEQIIQSAVAEGSADHPAVTSHVYNGGRNEIVYDPGKGLVVTDISYSDRLVF